MVQRLNVYARNHSALFSDVLHLIETDFVHILRRQSLAGKAVIRSASKTLDDPLAVNMVLDVLSERGFFVTLDVQKVSVPAFLHPAKPG